MVYYAQNVKRGPRTMTDPEVDGVLHTSGKHVDGFRDHMIMVLGFGAGFREHEIVALDIGDVYDAHGRAKRHVALRTFKGCRRPGAPETQDAILSESIRAKLDKYYIWKKRQGHDMRPEAPLFVSRGGGRGGARAGSRLSTRTVRHMFGVWQVRAGLERHNNFHRSRHTACSRLYRKTRDIRLVQEFARQASVQTAQIYAWPTEEDRLRAVQDLV